MSKVMKRKQVQREVLVIDSLSLTEKQQIVKIINCPGSNLHEVETCKGETYLVSLPSKFRKSVWLKRGDFVLVEPVEEGNKVKAEVVKILGKPQIKELKREGMWPDYFDTCEIPSAKKSESDEDIFTNTNRYVDSESESSDEFSSDED